MSLGHTLTEEDLKDNETFLSCFRKSNATKIISIDIRLTTFCNQNDDGEESFKFAVWCTPVREQLVKDGREELLTGDCCQCFFDKMFDMKEFAFKVADRVRECNMLGIVKEDSVFAKNNKRVWRFC